MQQFLNGAFCYNVISNSMFPLIKIGDRIYVRPFPGRVNIGDIVVFNNAGNLYVHRVVSKKRRKEETSYITKGDFSLNFDSKVKGLCLEDIIGKVIVVKNERGDLYLNNSLWSFLGYFIAIFSKLQAELLLNAKRIKIFIIGEKKYKMFYPIIRLYRKIFSFLPLTFDYLFRKDNIGFKPGGGI